MKFTFSSLSKKINLSSNFRSHKMHYSICIINLRTHFLMISLSFIIKYSGMRKIWMIFEKQLLIMKMKVAGNEIQVIIGTHF